ncbi:polysaccharide deacetylase family protein [Niveibacterium umoris]|uniref:Peptidoglycan/xylan/chitin deacetylase (PgdA/CDA1 family) n=1 Tax=Niveibacterium umoris TaxID=1193620 RepID=A0A840BU78_9RHOO|nr:polysaccharide deacetylase family protein [Niveibacterium umoris]MBB4014346.1 peptidoglycan/xylan/chitin deacetylase (PgdA/CDA1 family) [Niveibacterium umoris]
MRRTIPILMYHQVDVPPPSGTPMRGMVVSPGAFARQMRVLRLLGYRGVSLRDLEPWLRGERNDRVVGISFDDGYRNNLEHALPVLRANGFTATCYAVSNAFGGANDWDAAHGVPQKPLMQASEFRQWLDAGMDVGAHSRHHSDLTTLDAARARDEIAGSKRELESALQTEVRHFCYPYGRFDASHRALAAEAGYVTATTVQRGRARPGDDLLALPRVLVAQSNHLGHFIAKIATGYEDRYR